MTSTQTQKDPGNQKPNHELKAMAENPLRDNPEEPSRDGGFSTYNALAFHTLLSSQETDTHHGRTFVPRPGWAVFSNLPWNFHPVKLRPSGFPSHSVPAPAESLARAKVRNASSRWLPGSR